MTPLLPVETGPASDTVLALPDFGPAADDHHDAAQRPSLGRRILATFTAALDDTRRAAGD